MGVNDPFADCESKSGSICLIGGKWRKNGRNLFGSKTASVIRDFDNHVMVIAKGL